MRPYWHKALLLVCLVGFWLPLGGENTAQAHGLSQTRIEHSLLQQQHVSASTVNFWRHKGHWALHRRYEKCWQVHGTKQRNICRMSRQSLAFHSQRLAIIRRQLDRLQAPHDTGYLPPKQARLLGQKMAAYYYHWTGSEWNCLDTIWGKYHGRTLESDWNVLAKNQQSGAYGIPQSYPASKLAEFGSNWLTSAYVQIRWGLKYIRDRYHTPCEALSHWFANQSY